MGCVQKGRKIIINANKIIEINCKDPNDDVLSQISDSKAPNKRRQTLKEILNLAEKAKNIKLKSLATLVNAKPEDNYIIMNKLGKGSFGNVYKVKHKISGNIRAMKVIKNNTILRKDEKMKKKYLKEIQVLKELEHPNIIKIHEYYMDNKYHYIITELLKGGELYDSIVKVRRFNERKAAFIMRQILSALNYLHSKGIVHRDIKPENILVEKVETISDFDNDFESLRIKLIDFGASIFFKENKKLTVKIGSPYYIAPEVLKRSYDEKCDIWSSGVVLYVMLTGNFPFIGNTSQKLFENIKTGKYRKSGKEYEAISKEGKELIDQMLTLNPQKRITARECLNSPFFSNNNKTLKEIPDILPSVLSNIYKLNAREKLQQAAIAIIVHNIEQNEELEQLKEIFELLDINKDGHLTVNY